MKPLVVALLVTLLIANGQSFSLSKVTLMKYALQGIYNGVKKDIQSGIHDLLYGKVKPKTWGDSFGDQFDKLKGIGNSKYIV
jgi:hypothetical protein